MIQEVQDRNNSKRTKKKAYLHSEKTSCAIPPFLVCLFPREPRGEIDNITFPSFVMKASCWLKTTPLS
jgi:hypothetical protein